MDADNIGSFLQLEKAHKTFLKSGQKDRDRINLFYKTTEQIIANNIKNNKLRVVAYANLLEAESTILVTDLSKNLMILCGRVNDYKQTKTYKTWFTLETQYKKRIDAVFKYAFEQKDFLSVSNIGLDKVRWNYAKTFLNHIFKNWNKTTLSVVGLVNETDKASLLKDLSFLDRVAKSYEMLEHTENLVSYLSLKYELLHFAGCMDDADIIAKRIISIIKANDFNGLKARYDKLFDEGTGYEKFLKSFTGQMRKIYEVANASGLSEYLNQDISEKMLAFIEKDIEWSIDNFFEFNFSETSVVAD